MIISPIFLAIHLLTSVSMFLTIGWFGGDPLAAWPLLLVYWWLLRKHWRMGSQFLFNAGVAALLVNFALGWFEWRQPGCIGMARHAKGNTSQALAILDAALHDDPSSVEAHVARYQIAQGTLNLELMGREVAWFRESGNMATDAELAQVEWLVLTATPADAAAKLTLAIQQHPQAWWYRVLRGRCFLETGDFGSADADFRAALSGFEPVRSIWLRRPAAFVGWSYQASMAHMGLGHVARMQGDMVSSRKHIEAALAVFRKGSLAHDAGAPMSYLLVPQEKDDAGAPMSYLLVPQEKVVGNAVYAWAEVLARQAGDIPQADQLRREAATKLKSLHRNLVPFVEQHQRANSTPSLRNEIEAVRDAGPE